MDVVSRRISLTAWGRLYGFDKATTSRMHHAGKLPPELQVEQLPNRRYHRRKKAALEGESGRYSRMLSSFAYGKVKAYFISRGYRKGVEVHQVNPAFSSVIGRVKFMERYGLSVHQAAALVLARRLLGCSERIPRRRVCPVGSGAHVAFAVPCKEAREARVDVLGCGLGAAETGACSATPAGEASDGRPNPVQAVVRVEARGVA